MTKQQRGAIKKWWLVRAKPAQPAASVPLAELPLELNLPARGWQHAFNHHF
jgi:hypothetical protein